MDNFQMEETLRVILQPGQVTELRALGVSMPNYRAPHIVSGYFNDPAKLATEAGKLTAYAKGVYFVLNPVNPALLSRAANRVRPAGREPLTGNNDIIRRCRLPIDFDAVRPSGISSSDAEHEAALARAREVREFLKAEGWPEPVLADSGNGGHLVYRIDLPVDDGGLVQQVLKALAFWFNDQLVTIDESVFNPARIWKLYGTQARKGDSTPDRPHRRSRLLEVPDQLAPVSSKLLKSLASKMPKTPSPSRGRSRTSSKSFDVEKWIGEHDLKVTGPTPWQTGQRWILDTCLWDETHKNRSAFIVQFPNGAIAAGCHHNSCKGKGWRELRDKVEPEWKTKSVKFETHGSTDSHGIGTGVQYQATGSGLILLKPTKDGRVPIFLTNFTATIVAQITRDDGAETELCFEIEARLYGLVRKFTIPACRFAGMSWPVEHLGARAIVHAGYACKDHTRVAIQMLSENLTTRTVYTHIGWRRIEGKSVYLHAGGAIGSDGPMTGVEVELPKGLEGYSLPNPPAKDLLIKAIAASLRLLELAPDPVAVPVWAAIWRAALSTCDFAAHISGKTGLFKTEWAVLIQHHFGSGFSARNLPGSWSSTGNALEGLAFITKDAVLVVDDFAPSGTSRDVQRSHREAQRLLRAQGNNAGRARMRSDGTLRAAKPPRGLVLSTGEDAPQGQSCRARLLILELSKGDISPERLSRCQEDASGGLYALAMSGYLQWVAGRYEQVRSQLRKEITTLRRKATKSGQHSRTPEIVANLALGVQYFLEFAKDCGALTEEQAKVLWDRSWNALGKAAAVQSAYQAASDPVARFLSLLSSAITSGRAHVANSDGQAPEADEPEAWGWRFVTVGTGAYERDEWRAQGIQVGWIDGDDLYLDSEASYRAAQDMAGSDGEAIPVGARTLRKRLNERGLLVKEDKRQTLTVRRMLQGRQRNVLYMNASSLTCAEPDKPDISAISTGHPQLQPENATQMSDSMSGSPNASHKTCHQNLTFTPEKRPENEVADPKCQECQECQVSPTDRGKASKHSSIQVLDDLSPDQREAWDERVEICMSDGMSQEEAEKVAWRDIEAQNSQDDKEPKT